MATVEFNVTTVLRRRSKDAHQLTLRRCLSGESEQSCHRAPSWDGVEDAPFSVETCGSDDSLDDAPARSLHPLTSPATITIARPQRSSPSLFAFRNAWWRCKRKTKRACKGSLRLAFLSHVCFLAASALYLKLALVDLAWAHYARDHDLSEDSADDSSDSAGDPESQITAAAREAYDWQTVWLYVAGALLFTAVGLLDWLRHADPLYIFMALAGVTGIVSGLCEYLVDSPKRAMAWDCLSMHLYLIEGYTLMRGKKRKKKAHVCLRLGDASFFLGAILDVLVSDCAVAGLTGFWLRHLDVAAQSLWLACALIDLGEEVFWLYG